MPFSLHVTLSDVNARFARTFGLVHSLWLESDHTAHKNYLCHNRCFSRNVGENVPDRVAPFDYQIQLVQVLGSGVCPW